MRSGRPHRDVADRLRFFLNSVGLSPEQFVSAIDGAIARRSLYSVLSGARRPSRALAVLIERTWGLRAEYLLAGRGEPWTPAQSLGPGMVALELSEDEASVISFMRRSAENARTLVAELEQARAWSRLFASSLELVRELDACGASESPEDRRIYPFLVKIVYQHCRFMADQYEQLVTLMHRRRVSKLSDGYLQRFLDELPREALPREEQEALRGALTPVFERRRRKLQALEQSIARVHATIDNLCSLGSFAERARMHYRQPRIQHRMEALGRLSRLAEGRLQDELRALLNAIEADADPSASYSRRLRRLLRDVAESAEQDFPVVETQSVEKLREYYDALLDPLTT